MSVAVVMPRGEACLPSLTDLSFSKLSISTGCAAGSSATATEPIDDSVTVVGPSAIEGLGLFAARDLPSGTEVSRMREQRRMTRIEWETYHITHGLPHDAAIYVAGSPLVFYDATWLGGGETPPKWYRANHADAPTSNMVMKMNNPGAAPREQRFSWYTTRDVKVGEELTFTYTNVPRGDPKSFRAALEHLRAWTEPGATLSIPTLAAGFRHVRSGLYVAESTISGAGLGLFTSVPIGAGKLVGFFSGVWAYESDVDATFAASEACVQGYIAKWTPWVSPRDEPVPDPASPGQTVRSVDRLIVLPRINAVTTAGDACSLHYDPATPPSDVLALANHAAGGAGGAANVELESVLLPVRDSAGAVESRAALVMFTRDAVPGGAELLLNYGFEPTQRAKFKPARRRPLSRLQNTVRQLTVSEMHNQGQRTLAEMVLQGMQNSALGSVLGPAVVEVERSARTGSVVLEVAFTTLLPPGLSNEARAAAKQQLRRRVLGS